jgi:hypothetical protein
LVQTAPQHPASRFAVSFSEELNSFIVYYPCQLPGYFLAASRGISRSRSKLRVNSNRGLWTHFGPCPWNPFSEPSPSHDLHVTANRSNLKARGLKLAANSLPWLGLPQGQNRPESPVRLRGGKVYTCLREVQAGMDKRRNGGPREGPGVPGFSRSRDGGWQVR